MDPHPHILATAKVLAENPELAFDFYCAASEIVDDFDDYGPVIQANEDGVYDETTTLTQLRVARDKIIELRRAQELR